MGLLRTALPLTADDMTWFTEALWTQASGRRTPPEQGSRTPRGVATLRIITMIIVADFLEDVLCARRCSKCFHRFTDLKLKILLNVVTLISPILQRRPRHREAT